MTRTHTRRAASSMLSCIAIAASLFCAVATVRAEGGWYTGVWFDSIRPGVDSDGTRLAVCLTNDANFPGQHPGKVTAAGTCWIGYGGKEYATNRFFTLRPIWLTGTSQGGLSVGYESSGVTQAVCRGAHAGGLHVGKRIAGQNVCYVPYNGKEVGLTNYELLTDRASFKIDEESIDWFKEGAIVGGHEANGDPLYPCVASYAGGRHIGRMRKNRAECTISYGGGTYATREFTILVPSFMSENTDLIRAPIFRAGWESAQELGVCLAPVPGGVGSIAVGKYLFKTNSCNISYAGVEHVVTRDFQTLRTTTSGI